ncbi:MAG: DUF948 domain-containing protein [Stackebrandtia sp.]
MSHYFSAGANESVEPLELAALVGAGGFLVLCLAAAFLLLRARKTVDAATNAIRDVTARTGPMLDNVNATVEHVNASLTRVHTSLDEVNTQLERVDTITGHAQQVSGNVANLTTLVTAAASNPLVKLAAFGYGIRRAAAKRRNEQDEHEVRETLAEKRSRGKRRGRRRG